MNSTNYPDHSVIKRIKIMLSGLSLAVSALVAGPVSAALTVTPITWDVVGLDSNRPLTEGPELFPVAARVCSDVATADPIEVDFVWDNADTAWINNRPGSLTSLVFDPLPAGGCVDAYFELQVTRGAGAFEQSRPYRIVATTDGGAVTAQTLTPRQIYVERLVSQNRNTTTQIRWGQLVDQSDWQILGGDGTLNLAVGETYFIELTTDTATAYEQIQSFLTLSNTIFQVLEVSTEYSTLNFNPPIPDPNPSLYGDACQWEPDPDSPNYLSCLSVGKAGGTVVTEYQIRILSTGGDSVGLEALIYDFSGSSFHYNTDFSQSPGELVTFDPADSGFAKRFFPDLISVGATSRLVFTITNPNPVELGGYNFIDNLPADVVVAATPNASTTCGGIWNPQPGDTALAFDIDSDVIGPNSSCSIIVDVTAPEGTYDNTSENLFIGDFDTGLQAVDQLVVANMPPPPACVPGTEIASWRMDAAAGGTVPPLFTSKHPDVATALASFTAATGLSAPTNRISTADGNPVNAWLGKGWDVGAAGGPGPDSASYFEFTVDSSAFATNPAEPMAISLDVNPLVQGNWATAGDITVNVHVSRDGGPFTTLISQTPVNKVAWTTLTNAAVTPGSATTTFRINVNGRQNTAFDSAELAIDNIVFTGCGPGTPGTLPEPPTLAKAFTPATIGAGGISTLNFAITNPNLSSPAGDLTGITFVDNLPAGVSVAPAPNAASTCGGTVNAVAGASVISFDGGALAAGGVCQVSVDVTSTAVATHVNISDFIFADESGQNNTPTGFATANLTVLAPPVIEKAFDPGLLLLGVDEPDVNWLEFTITNPNPFNGIGGVAFDDFLPAGLTVAEPSTGPAELSVVKQLFSQSADPIVPGTTLTFEITATNTAGFGLTGVTVTDSLVAVDPVNDCVWPTVVQGELGVGESVICTVNYPVTQGDLDAGEVINTAGATSTETGSAVASYRLRTPLGDNGCGLETWAPVDGAVSVSLSTASIAPGGTCTVGTWVSGPIGVYANLSDPVSHSVGGIPYEGNQTADQLVIDNPIPAVALLKQVGLTSDPDGAWSDYLAVEAPADVFYKLTVENIGELPLTTIAVNDPTVDASGCTWPASLPVADAADPLAHIAECIVGPVSVASPDVVVNTATVTASSDLGNVQDTDTATLATAEIGLVKSADRSGFKVAGETINYTFTVTNTGAAILEGPVAITDPLIPSVLCPALVTVGNNDNYFDPGEVLVCSGSYTTTPTDVTNAQVQNSAFASVPLVDSNIDGVTVPLAVPALSIDKAAPASATVGVAFDYTLTVTNGGTAATTADATVTDVVPAGLTINAAPGCGVSGQTVTCTVASGLDFNAPNHTAVFTINVTPTASAANPILNTADVVGGGDPNCANPGDCPDSTSTPLNPQISASKTSDPATGSLVEPGQDINYTVSVVITGGSLTIDLVLTDTLGAGLTFGLVTGAGAFTVDDTNAPVLTFTLPSGTVPGTYQVSYSASVDEDASETVGNVVTVTGDGGDPDPECVPCETEHPVDEPVDPEVSVTKASNPVSGAAVSAGQMITYTLTAEVTEAALTSDLIVEDTLGPGLTFGSVSAPGAFAASTAGNPLEFTLASGTVPETYVIEYTATVGAEAVTSVGNTVAVTSDGGDPDPECPSCSTDHPVDEPLPPQDAIPVPVDNRLALIVLAMLLMLAGLIAGRRLSPQER